MKKVKLAILGLGGISKAHINNVRSGRARAEVVAVCDTDPAKLADPPAQPFDDPAKLLASGLAEAVLICTPHYAHTTLGIAALQAGLHVLTEKPISVHKADAARLIAARRDPTQVFAAMFQMRAHPTNAKIRELVRGGALGTVRRIALTATTWFRPHAYYASAGWRATWGGEGGGVLLNQCPHTLDLFAWFFGTPRRIHAWCGFGRYHDIEVEDDVTAFMEFDGSTTATFTASTGEAPGVDRLEVAGDNGLLVCENGAIRFRRNEVPTPEFSRATPEMFASPPAWDCSIPAAAPPADLHGALLANFCDAILDGTPLIAPAEEGLASVELANAMVLSSIEGRAVDLPLDGSAYEAMLQRLIADPAAARRGR